MAATTFPTAAAPTRPLRLGFLFALFAGVSLLLVARLVYWQVLDSPRLKTKITAQHQLDATVPARRGSIFDVNRDLLAGSVSVDYVYAQPSAVKKPEEAAAKLAAVLEVPADQ